MNKTLNGPTNFYQPHVIHAGDGWCEKVSLGCSWVACWKLTTRVHVLTWHVHVGGCYDRSFLVTSCIRIMYCRWIIPSRPKSTKGCSANWRSRWIIPCNAFLHNSWLLNIWTLFLLYFRGIPIPVVVTPRSLLVGYPRFRSPLLGQCSTYM